MVNSAGICKQNMAKDATNERWKHIDQNGQASKVKY